MSYRKESFSGDIKRTEYKVSVESAENRVEFGAQKNLQNNKWSGRY